jgi:RNA polymerase sigma factor (sigma-70 family)
MRVMSGAPQATQIVTDEELIVLSADGDRRSFGELFDRHSRVVYGLAMVALRNHADAEDVVSESFLTLWRKRASISFIDGSALPWLIVTTRHQAMNRKRASQRDAATLLNEEIYTETSSDAGATDAYKELTAQLDSTIRQLGPLEQKIVQLCLVDDLSYEQAAQHLGISHASVRNRLSRARTQLRQQLRSETQAHD